MKSVRTLLTFLAMAPLFVVLDAEATDATYVSNQSSRTLVASIDYGFPGSPEFTNRVITPGTYQSDTYGETNCDSANNNAYRVYLTIQIQNTGHGWTHMNLLCDHGVVAYDSPTNDGSVIVYFAFYGTINHRDFAGYSAPLYP